MKSENSLGEDEDEERMKTTPKKWRDEEHEKERIKSMRSKRSREFGKRCD